MTCLTCKHFEWNDGGQGCGYGTCWEASSMKCGKGYFSVKSFDSGIAQEQAIMKANNCKDYEAAKE